MSEFLKDALETISVYLWFISLACLGGTANYISKLKQNKSKTFSIAELLGELLISGFTGLMTYYLCMDQGLSIPLTSFAVGVAGHMGGRGMYLFEQYVLSKLPKPKDH